MQYLISPNVGLSSHFLIGYRSRNGGQKDEGGKLEARSGAPFRMKEHWIRQRLDGILRSREMLWENIPVVPEFTTSLEQLCSSK